MNETKGWTIREIFGVAIVNPNIGKKLRWRRFKENFVRHWQKLTAVKNPKWLPLRITGHSLVGIGNEKRPVTFGNYCHIGRSHDDDYYCVNMWAENIEEIQRLFPHIIKVQVRTFDRLCVIIDERIPIEYRNSFCTTGSSGYASPGAYQELEKFLK